MPSHRDTLLSVDDLKVSLRTDEGVVAPLRGVSLAVRTGEVFAIVGESGSGKTLTMTSILGLVDNQSVAMVSGRALFDGVDLLGLEDSRLRSIRGRDIGFIFQDPLSSLNPTMTVGGQIGEVISRHRPELRSSDVKMRVLDLLGEVGIPSPVERSAEYPFEFSGGMRQRVMIAMAIANDPRLIIADEPTTALDVTIQAQVLDTLQRLTADRGASLILITHDLGVVAEIAHRVAVMYAGRVVEAGTVEDIFTGPLHPYTRGLLASRPTISKRGLRLEPIPGSPPGMLDRPKGCPFQPRCNLGRDSAVCAEIEPGLEVVGPSGQEAACHHVDMPVPPMRIGQKTRLRLPAVTHTEMTLSTFALEKRFRIKPGGVFSSAKTVHAVRGASLELMRGRTLGLVGESGSGKSTIARLVVGVLDASGGSVTVDGKDLASMNPRGLRALRSSIQLVLQDPSSSLNPRMTAGQTVAEAVRVHHRTGQVATMKRVHDLLDLVGLRPEHSRRYPHEFSAGQRQRIAIARALAVDPRVLVLDEPVSALDVSIRAQVVNLLERIQDQLGVAYLFISHDLSVVRYIAHTVAVMYLGDIVETGPTDRVFEHPRHPYTKALLKSVPVDEPSQRRIDGRFVLRGEIPSPLDPPTGCPFRTRCDRADESCAVSPPPLTPMSTDGLHRAACFYPLDEPNSHASRSEGM